MSGVVDTVTGAVDDVFGDIPVLGEISDILIDVIDFIWYDIAMPILEWIFSLLGITDEDLLKGSATSKRLIPDEEIGKQLDAIGHVVGNSNRCLHPKGFIDTVKANIQRNRAKFRTPYYTADRLDHGLPDTQIESLSYDLEATATYINSLYSTAYTSADVSITRRMPTEDEWVTFQLIKLYGTLYNELKNTVTINGNLSNVYDVYYDQGSNTYVIRTMYKVTEVTNSSNTTVEDNIDNEDEGTTVSTSLEVEEDGNVETTTETTITRTVDVDNITTVVEEVVTVVTTHYNDDISVVANDVVHYYIINYDVAKVHCVSSDEVDDSYVASNEHFSAASLMPIVPLRVGSVNVNGVADSVYTNAYNKINAGTCTGEDTGVCYGMVGDSSLANDTNSDYFKSNEVLRSLGLTVDSLLEGVMVRPDNSQVTDAYVEFSIDPLDDSDSVRKAVYEMVRTLHNDPNPTEVTSTTTDSTTEGSSEGEEESTEESVEEPSERVAKTTYGSWNSVLVYDSLFTVSEVEVDDSEIGTITVEVDGYDLVVTHQANANTLETYRLIEVKAMTVLSRAGLSTMVIASFGPDSESELLFPLSFDMVNTLNHSELAEVAMKSLRLTIYASEIHHLEWYETDAFMSFLEIIIIVITLVILYFTWYDGGTAAEMFYGMAIGALAAYGGQMYGQYLVDKEVKKTEAFEKAIASIADKLEADIENIGVEKSELNLAELVHTIFDRSRPELTEDDLIEIASGEVQSNYDMLYDEKYKIICETKSELGFRGE